MTNSNTCVKETVPLANSPKQHRSKTRMIALVGIFSAISAILMLLEIPIPFMPPFLKVDISGVPVLMMAFLYGPMPAIYVALIKNVLHIPSGQTAGVGELADFLVLVSFVLVVSWIYQKHKNKKGVLLSMIAGTIAMTLVGSLANKFLIIPFYIQIGMPLQAIIDACHTINPMIDSLNAYVIFGAAPFNLIKGIILSMLTFLLYKKMSGFIRTRIGG